MKPSPVLYYHVKTRNWHCNRRIKPLLDLTLRFGVRRGDSYEDGDGKYCLETPNALKAWAVFAYFLALRHWTGGWTYIVRPSFDFSGGFSASDGYKAIY